MGVKLPSKRLGALLRRHLPVGEDDRTRLLGRRLKAARRRGYLTRGELIAACRWKSPRSAPHVRANNHHRIRAATSAALSATDEAARLEALVRLRGVSVPTASAILTLLDGRRYGVIDIRVWQLLHRAGRVTGNPEGVKLTTANWLEFLRVLRRLSSRFRVEARAVERTLFHIHTVHQEGTVYRKGRS